MKFKQFKIQNFMSWEKEIFDLSPNVNIICGVSDKGKSAILKGLKWLKDNDPSGNEFASDWIKKKKRKQFRNEAEAAKIMAHNILKNS